MLGAERELGGHALQLGDGWALVAVPHGQLVDAVSRVRAVAGVLVGVLVVAVKLAAGPVGGDAEAGDRLVRLHRDHVARVGALDKLEVGTGAAAELADPGGLAIVEKGHAHRREGAGRRVPGQEVHTVFLQHIGGRKRVPAHVLGGNQRLHFGRHRHGHHRRGPVGVPLVRVGLVDGGVVVAHHHSEHHLPGDALGHVDLELPAAAARVLLDVAVEPVHLAVGVLRRGTAVHAGVAAGGGGAHVARVREHLVVQSAQVLPLAQRLRLRLERLNVVVGHPGGAGVHAVHDLAEPRLARGVLPAGGANVLGLRLSGVPNHVTGRSQVHVVELLGLALELVLE